MDLDLPGVLIAIVAAGTILFVGIAGVNVVVETGDGASERVQTAALLDGTEYTTLGDSVGENETVYDSRGYAVALTGANDSSVQSERDVPIDSYQNWTVSVWASRDAAVTGQHTVLNIDGVAEIAYNGTRDEWTGWYYDDGARESWRVNATATSNATELANVVLTKNQSNLTIYANTTAGESADLTAPGTADYVPGDNWDGRLEEVRVHNTTWKQSTIDSHYAQPIDPIQSGAQARIMFDEPYRTQQRVFYLGGDVATGNVTYRQGLPGQELTGSGAVLEQPDYQWQTDGPRIRAVSGGELDGAPVAYVDYTDRRLMGTLIPGFTSAVALAGLLLIVVPLVYVIGTLQRAGGR